MIERLNRTSELGLTKHTERFLPEREKRILADEPRKPPGEHNVDRFRTTYVKRSVPLPKVKPVVEVSSPTMSEIAEANARRERLVNADAERRLAKARQRREHDGVEELSFE